MTTKKKAKVLPVSNERACRTHYKIKTPTHEMTEDELIDWLAQIAYDEQDWGWIRKELNRRFAELRKQLLRQQKSYEELWNTRSADFARLEAAIAEKMRQIHVEKMNQDAHSIAELEKSLQVMRSENVVHKESIVELQQSMDLRTDADDRAIKMWQEANPGNDHVWPDAAKLTVWLMSRLDALEGSYKDELDAHSQHIEEFRNKIFVLEEQLKEQLKAQDRVVG